MVAGAFGAHVPSLAQRYGFTERTLALALLSSTAGSVAMLFLAGRLIGHLGARRASVIGGWGFCAALLLLLQLPAAWLVVPVMILLGSGESLFDVAINTEGATLELMSGRAIMSGFHAMFSVGAMIGSALVAALFRLQIAPASQLTGIALLVLLSLTAVSGAMLPTHPRGADDGVHFAWPRGLLLTIGLLICVAMLAEGVMYNWSVLYVRQELGAAPDRAALAYVTFSAATAATRFAGDWLRARLPEVRVLQGGALLAAGAMATLLVVRHPVAAYIGFALVGAGLAIIVPILYNAATRVPGVSRAAALAAASSIGYVGFLLGPPIVGGIAGATSLTWALGTLVAACLVLCVGARAIRSPG